MSEKILNTPTFCRIPQHRSIEDFVVVWFDFNIPETNINYYQKSVSQLQHVVNSVSIFTDPDQGVDFLTEIKNEKVLLIISNNSSQQIIPFIQDLPQLQSIYIFEEHISNDKQWCKFFSKVKGMFDQIESICDALKQDIRQCNNSLIPISIINTSSLSNLNELDQSFMYTQLLKDNLIKMENNDEDKRKLIEYCRLQYEDSNSTLPVIEEFDQKYPDPSPIWWYTRECFAYYMLNKALRTQDVEIIIKMGFFSRDLHRQIERLYTESDNRQRFTVYRGQGMMKDEFMKMTRSKGGLLSFNNFLSTSTDRAVGKMFAESACGDPNLTGILFHMEIDPFISSTPFVSSNNISYYRDSEDEILFSMHTIFRIGDMEQIDDRLWEVHLQLTSDNDEQLAHLIDHMREKIDAPTGLHRLGSLMFVMGEFDKAEKIFKQLIETTSDEDWTMLASLYHMLGYTNYEMSNLSNALSHFTQSKSIELTHLPSDDPKLCRNYSGIGLILREQGDLDGALEHFQRSLEIDLHTSDPNQPNIATHHNNIGGILDEQGKYTDALNNYKRTLEIELIHLPHLHPSLAVTYNNIASVYDSLEDSLTALFYYKKALEIQEKSLPSNHSSLSMVHYNIAMTLEDLHRYEEAIEHAAQAVDIACRAFGPDHPEVKENQEYLDELRLNI